MMSYSEYYGCGSTKARVYASLDFLAVILEETFTPADKTLIARGEAGGIQDIRRRVRRSMADQFKAVVEQGTGRAVRSFLSETLTTRSRLRSSSSRTLGLSE